MFRKVELYDQKVLIHFNDASPKTLQQAQRIFGPMVDLHNIYFESKTTAEILLELNLRKKYTFPQQHDANALF